MDFSQLDIKSEYRSLSDNVVKDFYIPLLKNAVLYKRAVGFFSSSALIEISKGITGLINNGGRIMLIASPRLSPDDIKAINKGYEERNNVIERSLIKSFTEPENYFEAERLNLLATLIAEEKLDIKIAFTESENKMGIFHEKMGLMYDNSNNIVAFTGSMNETGMAFLSNYEAIDVFCSWENEETFKRVINKEIAFKNLWNNSELNVEIIDFPKVAYEKLQTYKKDKVNMNIDEEEVESHITENEAAYFKTSTPNTPIKPANISFYDYQLQAISEWAKNDYKGIFDMATGTGKTLTGLGAIVDLYQHCNGNLAIIIVCPYQHLVEQWVEDIVKFNINPVICYSAYDWKKKYKNIINDFRLGIIKNFCVITTNATFTTPFFQNEVDKLKGNVCLVVDEAHNFGAKKQLDCMKDIFKYRLALSATLERHHDDEGTQKLKDYFGAKCIEYSLERAIKEDKLTPYYYYPIPISLDADELDEYNELTEKIIKILFKNPKDKPLPKTAETLLIGVVTG